MATAVISASEGMHYAHEVFPAIPVVGATVGLLCFFTLLTIIGISESSFLAIGIFVFHIVSLVILLTAGIIFISGNGISLLMDNLATPAPGGMGKALLFGFCAAMLGISGFESSANFVEEQQPGVFPKTLRNMWFAVSFFNPIMALLALALLPLSAVPLHENALLAHMGRESAGPWLGTLISIDAAIVLSGAVLTSFIGVDGLVARMTLDRCLPQFLLKRNRRGTTHRILIAFFLLCLSVLFITKGDLAALAGVYTLSFLSVMLLFGLGNILLKIKRSTLPRPEIASWPTVIIAMVAIFIGLIGNAVMNPHYLIVFLEYFIPASLIVIIMLTRTMLLKALLFVARRGASFLLGPPNSLTHWARNAIERINSQQVVFFTRGDSVSNLNKVMLYVGKNEHSKAVKIVHVLEDGEILSPKLEETLKFLDEAYPELDIEFVIMEGKFGPELIHTLSEKWKIPANFMFIGSPGKGLPHSLSELGGVRVIV